MANQVKLKRPVSKSVPAAKAKKTLDPTVMTYRALMPLQVGIADGSVQSRVYGDFVPEAASWKNIGIWLKTNRIQQVYVNQSEIDAWQERYNERIAEELEAKKEADQREKRLSELRAEMAALEAADSKRAPDFNAEPKDRNFKPDKTVEEFIDFGGVKFNGTGAKELPKTRAPQVPANTAENRTRPAPARRVVRKKV